MVVRSVSQGNRGPSIHQKFIGSFTSPVKTTEIVVLPPGGVAWAQVDHGEETRFTKIKLQNHRNATFKCTKIVHSSIIGQLWRPSVVGGFPQTLARSPSSCSVWDAHTLGERLQALPVMGASPAKVIRRTDANNHTDTESPVGAQS